MKERSSRHPQQHSASLAREMMATSRDEAGGDCGPLVACQRQVATSLCLSLFALVSQEQLRAWVSSERERLRESSGTLQQTHCGCVYVYVFVCRRSIMS